MGNLFRKYLFEIICLLPLGLFLLFFTCYPILRVVLMSFGRAGGGLTLAHYSALLASGAFRRAFINTILIAGGSLAVELTVGMFMALVLARRMPGRDVIRTLFLLPLAIPTVVVGVMMSYIFSTSGWLNRFLSDLHFIQAPVHWMSGGPQSLLMLILADSWKVTPLVMLILLAGLKSIDRTLYEAARVDGAGTWQVFRRVSLPLIMPYITTAVIIRGIDAFRIFALPLVLMGQNLKVIGTFAYVEYMDYGNMHLSAASAVVLFFMIMSAVFVYIKCAGQEGMQAT